MRQEMMGFRDAVASAGPIYTSFRTDNYTNTSQLNFYRPGAPSDTQPTELKHWQNTGTDKMKTANRNFCRVQQ